MRTKRYFTLLLSLLLFMSCIESDADSCIAEFDLIVCAQDNSGNDILVDSNLTDGYLYIYNDNKEFIAKYFISKEMIADHQPIKLSLCPQKGYYAVAWIAPNVAEMTLFNPTSPLTSNLVFFLQNEGGYQTINSNLLHGTIKIALYPSNGGIHRETLVVKRKFASIHISIKGVNRSYSAKDYKVVIEGGFYRAFSFDGKPAAPTLTDNQYTSTMEWSDYNNLLVMPKAIKVAPLATSKSFSVSIYHLGQLIKQVKSDHIDYPIAPQAGERMNVLIDLSKNDTEVNSSQVELYVRVSDWNKVELWEEW